MPRRTQHFASENTLPGVRTLTPLCERQRDANSHPVISTGFKYQTMPITTRMRVIFQREARSQSYYSPAATIVTFDGGFQMIGEGSVRRSQMSVLNGAAEGIANDIRDQSEIVTKNSILAPLAGSSSRNGEGHSGR